MSIKALLLGAILIIIGFFMLTNSRRILTALKEYESENRSSDGVVEFPSEHLSKTHAADKGLHTVLSILGVVLGIVGVVFIVAWVKL